MSRPFLTGPPSGAPATVSSLVADLRDLGVGLGTSSWLTHRCAQLVG
jgi:hypothetical protein